MDQCADASATSVEVSIGGFVSRRPPGCCWATRRWQWIEGHVVRATLKEGETVAAFLASGVAPALAKIAVSDAQGNAGAIALTPADCQWLQYEETAATRIRLLAPDPGNMIKGRCCPPGSSSRFPWRSANAVLEVEQPVAPLVGEGRAVKVTILPHEPAAAM